MTPFICSIAGLLQTPVPRSTCTAELSFGRTKLIQIVSFPVSMLSQSFWKSSDFDHSHCMSRSCGLQRSQRTWNFSCHFNPFWNLWGFWIFCTWKHVHCHSPVSKLCCSFQTGRSKTRKEHLSGEIRNRMAPDGTDAMGAGFLRAAQMWLANFERYKQQTWRETWQLIHAKSKSAATQLF